MFSIIKSKAIGMKNNTKKIVQDDPRRIIHSLKVGLALTLVSLFYYFRPLYNGFGSSALWAVLTVVVVFEFTVGATISKSINRSIATLSAGALGIGAAKLASFFGHKGEPIVLGISVFILATTMTFLRFLPRIKAKYDYGMLIFILTFSLVTISGFRVGQIVELAHQRLSTIVIGGVSCILISCLIFPVWAGEDLQNILVTNLENLAMFLEGFGGEFHCSDKSFLLHYKCVLNTKNSEESLANFAWWEPRHGNFRYGHPYDLYLKIGVLIRKCGYNIEVLSNYLNTDLQIPTQLENKIKQPCMEMSSQSSKALRDLATSLKTMTNPSSHCTHLEKSKKAVNDLITALQISLSFHQNIKLMEIIPVLAIVSILIDIVKCIENTHSAVSELAQKAKFKNKVEHEVGLERITQLLRRGAINPIGDYNKDFVVITIDEISSELPEEEETLPHETSIRVEE